MSENYCVIGSPIAHSLSPAIHNTLYEIYQLKGCSYGKRLVTQETLESFLESIASEHICGFNITMPLKQDIIPYLRSLSPEAEDGVNTVVVKKDGLYGYSTDAQGFYASLKSIGADYRGADLVLIGAGAVTKLLCADAHQKGAKRITIINRTPEKAETIALQYHAGFDSLPNLHAYMDTCDLLINTTSLGMHGTQADFSDLNFIDLLPANAAVCDLIYSPLQTALLKHAAARGLKTMNGLGMLIWQAFFAFEKWFGILPTKEDFQIVLERLEHLR